MNNTKHYWTSDQIYTLTKMYPVERTIDIANELGLPLLAVRRKAKKLGLKKSDVFWQSKNSGRIKDSNKATQFKPGIAPWNKGKHVDVGGRSIETRFKPGSKPSNWKPIGSERLAKDGYLQRKLTDTGYPPRDWVGVHIILYQEHHGPIPDGHIVKFKDGNKKNIQISNLELISRIENMKRNSLYQYPKEIIDLHRLRGTVNRQINRLKDKNEHS